MSTTYHSQLATMLFLKPASLRQPAPGRLVRFDLTEADPRFNSGPVQDRVIRYLQTHRQPITVGKLAIAVDTRGERVLASLKRLVAMGAVVVHHIDEELTEYTIAS